MKKRKKLKVEIVCNGNRHCSVCGGLFDEDGVCNVGKHVRGLRYTKR